MRLIEKHGLFPDCIVVDGYVNLNGVFTPAWAGASSMRLEERFR
jgi:hypothetical protein